MSPSSYVRAAGIASVLGATFVLLGIGIAGVLTPDYNAIRDLISASQLGPYGSLVTLGLTGGGSLTVVVASLLRRTLPPGTAIGPGLLVLRGFGTLLAAAFLADVGPVRSVSGLLHVVGLVGGSLAFGIGLFFLAGRMRLDEDWQRLAPYTVTTALASLAVLGLRVGRAPRRAIARSPMTRAVTGRADARRIIRCARSRTTRSASCARSRKSRRS